MNNPASYLHTCPGCGKKHPCDILGLRPHKPVPFLGVVAAVHLVACTTTGENYIVGFNTAGNAFFRLQKAEAHGLPKAEVEDGPARIETNQVLSFQEEPKGMMNTREETR